MLLQIQLIFIYYCLVFLRRKKDKRWDNVGSNRWMRKALYVLHCLLSDIFLSKLYQNFLDRDVDTLVHVKDVVDGFNSVQKGYLATCLIIPRTLEKDKIDSNYMRVEAMTEKGEVCFAE